MTISFDIETAPLPEERIKPYFSEVGEFDESQVKLGNLKDPGKISAKIADARSKHEDAKRKAWQEFVEAAPLNAAIGRVLCIGVASESGFLVLEGEESEVLAQFWRAACRFVESRRLMIGVNILEFDLPFLFRRSMALGIDVPKLVLADRESKWPKWNPFFRDLGKIWLAGAHPVSCKWGFDTLAAAFGTPGKVDIGGGGEFWKLYQRDREKAIEYLKQDCVQPLVWAKQMGVTR